MFEANFCNLIFYILKLAQAYYSYVVCVVLFVFHYPYLKETAIMTLIHEQSQFTELTVLKPVTLSSYQYLDCNDLLF